MITILGGGVAGAALAWALSRRGRRDVVVFDLLPAGSGSTTKAMGGFRTQHGNPLKIRLSLAARPWFEERAERVHFQPHGYLYLADGEEAAVELGRRAEIQKQCGLPISHPDPKSLVPFIEDGDLRGTNFCALDGVYWPAEILRCFIEEAQALGAQFRYGAEAGPGDLEAEAVVVCAGIWSRRVGEELGVELKVDPLERGIFVAGPFDWLPERVPMTLEVASGYHFRERERRLLMTGPGDQS
ncbi:MAG TPA: FAD-dependent oxidoreductase, partial [Candidatus Acidoferrales bacterium]|nr:FAD-dependent oxidoreductase [Candidatus Acidoferrales bacterium]